MKVSHFVNSRFGWFITVAGLGMLAIFVYGGCGSGEPGEPLGTGGLSVQLGQGAGTAGGSFCEGKGTVSIESPISAIQSQDFAFTGISSSTSPACTTGVVFSNLQPAIWTILVLPGHAICQQQVKAGQTTTARIRVDTRTCQW